MIDYFVYSLMHLRSAARLVVVLLVVLWLLKLFRDMFHPEKP
jgi:hypothetical protein